MPCNPHHVPTNPSSNSAGFKFVASGPLVRSSYKAGEAFLEVRFFFRFFRTRQARPSSRYATSYK
ncbi:hypothetical protein T492DRAFT_981830 [Pavlovales sp. CCMP2436]|nr:hypothetical protein T492DRAFT_981830 [Pavlovales sp. CCMP2436]